ncbi:MAG: DegT/DnrJ/EryC1/StrS family aminotransferase [Thermoguttaceae bacterium]
MFSVLLPTAAGRDALLEHLRAEGIHAVFHDIPLHRSTMGRGLGCAGTHLPVTDDLSARIVRLPMYYEITEEEQGRVVDGLTARCEAAPRTAAG